MTDEYDLAHFLKDATRVQILGFDSGCRWDADFQTLLALIGGYGPEDRYKPFDQACSEGVLGLRIDGEDVYAEILVDPQDGYRSSYGGAIVRPPPQGVVMALSHEPPDVVVLMTTGGDDGTTTIDLRLTDRDGHVWFECGTDYSDGYYPMGFARWMPKRPLEE